MPCKLLVVRKQLKIKLRKSNQMGTKKDISLHRQQIVMACMILKIKILKGF